MPATQTIEFCAEPILENGAISWMYSMNVKIDIGNGGIYLNDVLYDQISYIEGVELDWGTPISGINKVEMMREAISKINGQKGCYILETTSESKYGKIIAMYVIGNDYYFIRFFDSGTVMRVHSGTVQ